MTWLAVALAAFFLFAVAVVADKLMLSRTAIAPLAYAFSICLMSAAASLVLYLPILIGEGRFFLPRGFPLAAWPRAACPSFSACCSCSRPCAAGRCPRPAP